MTRISEAESAAVMWLRGRTRKDRKLLDQSDLVRLLRSDKPICADVVGALLTAAKPFVGLNEEDGWCTGALVDALGARLIEGKPPNSVSGYIVHVDIPSGEHFTEHLFFASAQIAYDFAICDFPEAAQIRLLNGSAALCRYLHDGKEVIAEGVIQTTLRNMGRRPAFRIDLVHRPVGFRPGGRIKNSLKRDLDEQNFLSAFGLSDRHTSHRSIASTRKGIIAHNRNALADAIRTINADRLLREALAANFDPDGATPFKLALVPRLARSKGHPAKSEAEHVLAEAQAASASGAAIPDGRQNVKFSKERLHTASRSLGKKEETIRKEARRGLRRVCPAD